MLQLQTLLLAGLALQGSSLQPNSDTVAPPTHRGVRQLDFGGFLNPTSNQQTKRQGPPCTAPGNQNGKCLPMEQCVLKALNDDYIKNKGYLCALRPEGPVGVCCPNAVTKPTVYTEGMFGNKNFAFGKSGASDDTLSSSSIPPANSETA